jgi:hypothetical protein
MTDQDGDITALVLRESPRLGSFIRRRVATIGLLAARAEALGATMSRNAAVLTPEALRAAVERVSSDAGVRAGLRRIKDSFKAAGGYALAAQSILAAPARQRL